MEEVKDFWGKSIQHVFEDLGLVDYYPGKISLEIAKSKQKKRVVDLKDIPWVFLENVLNPAYDGRSIFFTGQSCDDNASVSSEEDWGDLDTEILAPYVYMDIALTVFLCCDNECKEHLSYMLHESDLSAPIVLPDMSKENGLIVQISAIRGITKEVGYDTHMPIVSFVCVNGDSTVKTKLLNTLLCTEDDHKPFYNEEVELTKMSAGPNASFFAYGAIEAAFSHDHPTMSHHEIHPFSKHASESSAYLEKNALFLNLYGMSQDFELQRALVCQISTLVVVIVDTNELCGNTEAINNIRDICETSKKALVVFNKKEDDDLDHCKKGVGELIGAIKSVGCQPQVMVLFHRITGKPDNIHMVRGHLRKQINLILDTFDHDETTLKEKLSQLENVSWDTE